MTIIPEAGNQKTTPTFFAAPDLARAGYHVIPLRQKKPGVSGGFYAATTDHSQIAAWIEEGLEHHDIGIATGNLTDLIVIEADNPEAYARMVKEFGEPHVKTRRGGHWYFKAPRDGKVVSRKIEAGLDCKGDGGLVAAPPSTNKSWTNGIPDLATLPPLPAVLRNKLRSAPADYNPKSEHNGDTPRVEKLVKEHAAIVIARYVQDLEVGDRHEHLKHMCGVFLSRIHKDDAQDILIRAWNLTGDEELIKRAPHEVSNTLNTTVGAIANKTATGVPSMKELTPGLMEELDEIFGWEAELLVESSSRNDSSLHSPLVGNEMINHENSIVFFSELGKPKPRRYILQDVAAKGYPLILFGAGGVAKSFAALLLGIGVAGGADKWLGLDIVEHGPALYLDFELDQDEQHRRVRDLCNGLDAKIPEQLAYLSAVGMSTQDAFKKAYEFCQENNTVALVIDSIGIAMQGAMMKSEEVLGFHRKYLEPFMRLSTTPFLVDHEGKLQTGENHQDKTPYGSAFKTWASRSVLQFQSEGYDKDAGILDIRIRHKKTNFGPQLDPFGASVAFEDAKVSFEVRELSTEELVSERTRPSTQRILEALEGGDKTAQEIADETDLVKGTVANKLSELSKLVPPKVEVKGKDGKTKIYGRTKDSSLHLSLGGNEMMKHEVDGREAIVTTKDPNGPRQVFTVSEAFAEFERGPKTGSALALEHYREKPSEPERLRRLARAVLFATRRSSEVWSKEEWDLHCGIVREAAERFATR